MDQKKVQPVILSGGAGTRLWPLSRAQYPKQLLKMVGDQTMIQQTVARVTDAAHFLPPLVICNDEHRFIIAEQLEEIHIKAADILVEPLPRSTAAPIAAAALLAARTDAGQLLLVMPSDHAISDLKAFSAAIAQGVMAAEAGHVVTFGIKPSQPETGYGYILKGKAQDTPGAHDITRFVEKPDRATALQYLADGNYLWNSGLFLARADVLINEFRALAPEILAAVEAALGKSTRNLDFTRLDEAAFADSPAMAFDNAIMEKTGHGAVIPVDMGWSDIGTWHALWDELPQDEDGNALVGDVLVERSKNCLVRSDRVLTAVLGAENMVVIATPDAVLVAPRDQTHEVGKLVERLKKAGRSEAKSHRISYRPWGSYETLALAPRFQVKRIVVHPGGQLSLQKHFHRAEHWTVVEGTARVTVGDQVHLLSENQSVYVPLGEVHRLENPGKVPLTLIEVQSGAYLGEDDIVRLEDAYARAPSA